MLCARYLTLKAKHREADAVVKRLVALERNLHAAQFERQRYEMLWTSSTQRYEGEFLCFC